MPLNRNERAHALAALLRKDYGAFTSTIEKTSHMSQPTKIRLLAAVLRHQNNGDELGVEEIIRLIGGE